MLETLEAPKAAPRLQRAHGAGALSSKSRAGRSVLDRLFQDGCCKIRVPKPQGAALEGVLINSSGGLTDGDRVAWHVETGADTHLSVTTQACERIYRAAHTAPAQLDTTITVGAKARLDWLPQETILFAGARLARTLEVDMAPDATFLGLEAVIVGRTQMGEDARSAALSDRWRVFRDGALVHAEASTLAPDCDTTRQSPALLDGARAFATLCYIAQDAERQEARLRDTLDRAPTCAVSRIGDKLMVRALGPNGYRLRKTLMPAIAALTPAGATPKLWTL